MAVQPSFVMRLASLLDLEAESSLSGRQLLSWSINSLHFTEPRISLS
jgi:hypothetical protein